MILKDISSMDDACMAVTCWSVRVEIKVWELGEGHFPRGKAKYGIGLHPISLPGPQKSRKIKHSNAAQQDLLLRGFRSRYGL